MGILSRCGDILRANVNAILDQMEDPSKMIDQYLRDLMEDLAEVKKETAGVMAEESRAKRLVDDNAAEVERYAALAKKALGAGNEDDARVFIEKKQKLEATGAGLQTAYLSARENAEKMRQMHDKLTSDIQELNARREVIRAKMAVAKTQEKLNQVSSGAEKAQDAMDAFGRMEAKANKRLDEANAMAQLNAEPVDEAKALEEKYSARGGAAVDDELARLKKEMGL